NVAFLIRRPSRFGNTGWPGTGRSGRRSRRMVSISGGSSMLRRAVRVFGAPRTPKWNDARMKAIPCSRSTLSHESAAASLGREAERGDSMLDDSANLIRTAFGAAPRCQAQCKATRERCGRPARRGFTVCSVHGAGTRRRELAGVRTNPRAGSLVHGGRAQQATLVALREVDAAFAAARAEVARLPDRLRAIDDALADLSALRQLLLH